MCAGVSWCVCAREPLSSPSRRRAPPPSHPPPSPHLAAAHQLAHPDLTSATHTPALKGCLCTVPLSPPSISPEPPPEHPDQPAPPVPPDPAPANPRAQSATTCVLTTHRVRVRVCAHWPSTRVHKGAVPWPGSPPRSSSSRRTAPAALCSIDLCLSIFRFVVVPAVPRRLPQRPLTLMYIIIFNRATYIYAHALSAPATTTATHTAFPPHEKGGARWCLRVCCINIFMYDSCMLHVCVYA